MAKRFITISLILFVVALGGLSLKSCGPNTWKEFEKQVNVFGADDTISVKEWDELVAYVALHIDDRAFGRFLTNKSLDEEKLKTYLKNRGYEIEEPKPVQPTTVNIYIENSGSMFGFVNGNTGFKNALTKLIVDLKSRGYLEDDIKFHFINRTITPIAVTGKIDDYPISLSEKAMRDEDSNDSNINDIYRQILENTVENTISILLSDCIYSVHQDIMNNDVEGALRIWKTRTIGVFNDIIREKALLTLLVQLTSDFTGNYYTKENRSIYLNKQQIPYYLTVIGKEKELNKFSFVEQFDGYKNKLVLTTQDYSENTFYSLIRTDADNGDYKPARNRNSDPTVVQAIEGIRFRGRGDDTFIFSLAVDFSKLPVDTDYVLDPSNYVIEKGNYEMVAISPFDASQVHPNVLTGLERNNQNPTHIVVFKSTANLYTDLVFSLKKNIPDWVYAWNTNDDSDIKVHPEKTFGFKYLVEGIFEAYQNSSSNKDYITCTIQIKK